MFPYCQKSYSANCQIDKISATHIPLLSIHCHPDVPGVQKTSGDILALGPGHLQHTETLVREPGGQTVHVETKQISQANRQAEDLLSFPRVLLSRSSVLVLKWNNTDTLCRCQSPAGPQLPLRPGERRTGRHKAPEARSPGGEEPAAWGTIRTPWQGAGESCHDGHP